MHVTAAHNGIHWGKTLDNYEVTGFGIALSFSHFHNHRKLHQQLLSATTNIVMLTVSLHSSEKSIWPTLTAKLTLTETKLTKERPWEWHRVDSQWKRDHQVLSQFFLRSTPPNNPGMQPSYAMGALSSWLSHVLFKHQCICHCGSISHVLFKHECFCQHDYYGPRFRFCPFWWPLHGLKL